MSKNLIRHLLGEDAIPDFKDAFPLKRQKKRKKENEVGKKKKIQKNSNAARNICAASLARVC